MQIKDVNVAEIKKYSRNAKTHPRDQIEAIANSIKNFGFKQPLVLDKDNTIIIGHGRLAAAEYLGLETVPCIMAEDLTPEQANALRLADNKTNESPWDMETLKTELTAFEDIDMSLFGFENILEDEELVEAMDLNDVPEETNDQKSDVFQCHCPKCGFYFEVKK